MRYARTIDGTVNEILAESDNAVTLRPNGFARPDWHIECRKSKILKESDDVEKLFDEYVVDAFGAHCNCQKKEDFDKLVDIFPPDFNFKMYGAVWTDRGLIYVARMNDKGEWKLL